MRTLLWLLGLACFTSRLRAERLNVMSAPNLLRVGTAERIFVECQDCGDRNEPGYQASMDVEISIWDFPLKQSRLKHTTVTLNEGNKFQALTELVIPTDKFGKDPKVKQYVYLLAAFPENTLEKVVLTSFQSGYLFVQTDKTLYTPDSTVLYRVFALTPGMKPVPTGSTVEVEIMTPEGVVFPITRATLRSGMHSGSYTFGRIASSGKWEIVAKLSGSSQETFSAKFEVKEYVLPSYEVKVTSESSFYYYDADSFTVSVTAKYLFGKQVEGMAYVVFGVLIDDNKKVFPSSLQRIEITEGAGEATLQKADILKIFPNIERDLVGRFLFVSATVYTESGSEMVMGEMRNVQIVKSPYSINFDKTPKYYIPDVPFSATATVHNPDGTPAERIPVIMWGPDNERVHATTGTNGRATLKINHRQTDSGLLITAMTNDSNLPSNRQTRFSMEVHPQQSTTQNFIDIMMSGRVELGANLQFQLSLTKQSVGFDISYLIQSRGQLVQFGRVQSGNRKVIALNIQVKKEMLPSFRLIAYYHPTRDSVVSNSMWVDVDNFCMGTLKLEPTDRANSYLPGKIFNLKITGDPGAHVGLVAVDKGVYVLSKKHLLTQKKVWETVEKADTGCTPGGGKNSMEVFFDAGLLFQTNSAGETPYRQEVKCPSPPSRKRRAGTLLDAITTLASRYNGLERECCQDGMKNTPLSYTCAQRTLYITDGEACKKAFRVCCEELEKQRSDLKQNTLILARSEEKDDYMDNDEITSRTQFPESWLWKTEILKQNTLIVPNIALKDSITTWVFTGISISEDTGICVGKPLEVIAFKSFFIDLKLPYSAVVGEQIEIRAILHNYINTKEEATVRYELIENPDVCSSASRRGSYTDYVRMSPQTNIAVPFVIIPMKEGILNIKVRAVVRGMDQSDEITKKLRVVQKGVLTYVKMDFDLNPEDGTRSIVNTIPRSGMLPSSPSFTRAFVTGRENISPLVDGVLGTSSMGNLIQQPSGCGEQNMYLMSLTVITTTYLDRTNKWEAAGLGKRTEALSYIENGFTNEMTYAKPDGSFAIWKDTAVGSTWLTAYVVKIFSMARNLANIQEGPVCNAVKYLILKAQQPDGMFIETGSVYHREYTGDVFGEESGASLTAFCLIAMQESKHICSQHVNSLPQAISQSVKFLEERLPKLKQTYAVAITSYALANENKLNKDILYNFASADKTHWASRGDVFTLEATAYALLALLKGQFLEEARPVMKWLNTKQKVGGGFGSTQATVIVYQALSEYWATVKEPDYNVVVQLKVPGRNAPYPFRLTQNDQHVTRTTHQYPDINANLTVTTSGTGEAKLTLITQYYAVPRDTVSDCTRFNLALNFSLDEADEAEGDVYKLRMTFSFKNETEDALMSILDVSLPTGFIPINEDLNALSTGRARFVDKWEENRALSERGSIIFYLKKVFRDRDQELAFRMRRKLNVGVLQPASVSIYEYYDETKCVKYYHPEKKAGVITRRCQGDVCQCAEEKCSMQKKNKIGPQERLRKACQADDTVSIDYVYKTMVKEVVYEESFDTFEMEIETVIKEGADKVPPNGRRNFTSASDCRESLNLQPNKQYLIMGTNEDLFKSTQPYLYLLGERAWIEYWPREEDECQEDDYAETCIGLEDLVYKYDKHGCQQ